MNKNAKHTILKEIVPRVQNGDLTLFLGAGFSIGTPAINKLGIPSTQELINRICDKAGFDETDKKSADLPTTFSVGSDEIEDFDNFLSANFTTAIPFEWQVSVFKYWWKSIFTTNIDNIPQKSLFILRNQKEEFPDYQYFNYLDKEPVEAFPTEPPIVTLHGSVERMVDGFVFDRISYAENTVNMRDWIRKSALHISHGHCLFVGSKFKESDIEAAIRERENLFRNEQTVNSNWMILNAVTSLERRAYKRRGIEVIEADAQEFFEFLFSNLSYMSPEKFIRRKAPYLKRVSDNKAADWFSSYMDNVTVCLSKATSKTGPFSRFYFGDAPSWFYISKDAHAQFPTAKKIEKEILDFEKTDNSVLLISVIGPLGSGKTTVCMDSIACISRTHSNTYMYSGLGGIDIEFVWKVIKDTKGLVTIFVDSASSHFYAINALIKRVDTRATSCKLCFVVEERQIQFVRNRHHFQDVRANCHKIINVDILTKEEAGILYDKSKLLGIEYEKLQDLDRNSAIALILDYENGYKGDLLTTLYDLSSQQSYKEKLAEEYSEIGDKEARKVFQTISLVTATRLFLPASYLAETHGVHINKIARILNVDLKGKVHLRESSMTVSARHHLISEFHIANNFKKADLKELIIQLMHCLSKKFEVEDIKKHPLSYEIYKKLLSFHYLTEVLFTGKIDYPLVDKIYSECQVLFSRDGIFWLQYGRFLSLDGRISEALYCLKRGLDLYDSFQIRHALGQLLLKKFRVEGCKNYEDYEEGLKILVNEIDARGTIDSYPFTALGNELVKIIGKASNNEEYMSKTKEIINRGLKHHKEDDYFMSMVKQYIRVSGETLH